MQRGTQIVYIPDHVGAMYTAPSWLEKRGCDWGFVSSIRGDVAFCRYWSKTEIGELRTKSCSEGTPIRNLKEVRSAPQATVDAMLARIDAEETS